MILADGAVSKAARDILNSDKVIGIDSRHTFSSGFRYWVLPNGHTPEETK